MKKIFSLLLALLMCLCIVSCSAKNENNEEEKENGANIANPIKEYDSLDKINEVTKCHIVIPSSIAASDVVYSTINDEAAQVQFTYNNHKWTVRGSHDTTTDLSGVHDENNVFEPNQDYTVYLNDYYIERMFTEGQQYTVVMDTPELNDEEFFSETVWEIMQAIKNACDPNGIAGEYADSVSQRATMTISKYDDMYEVIVQWANDATSTKEWVMAAKFEDGKLTYEGEDSGVYVTDANGEVNYTNQTTSNNVGSFELKEGKLYWTGAAEDSCKSCIFEKVQ